MVLKGHDFRAKPEFLWPGEFRARSPLPDGRVDFREVPSRNSNSGFAIVVPQIHPKSLGLYSCGKTQICH